MDLPADKRRASRRQDSRRAAGRATPGARRPFLMPKRRYGTGSPFQRAAEQPELYRFLDAGNTEAGRTLSEPASKKRRCTKSRDAGQRLGGERYGDFSLASLPMVQWRRKPAATRRACPDAGAGERARRAPRRSLGAYQRATGASIAVNGAERDRRQRGASAKGRESGGARRTCGS